MMTRQIVFMKDTLLDRRHGNAFFPAIHQRSDFVLNIIRVLFDARVTNDRDCDLDGQTTLETTPCTFRLNFIVELNKIADICFQLTDTA